MAEPDVNTNWWEGFDPETKGYVTARGLDKKPAPEALALTIQAHREAEKKLGIPSDRVFAWPAPEDTAGMAKVWEKLGVPATAAEYKLEGVEAEAPFLELIRNAAHELKLTPVAAAELAKRVTKYGTDAKEAETNAEKVKIATAQAALDMQWGQNKEVNTFVAQRAAAQLGLSADVIANLANTAGYEKTMEALRKIGVGMGEGKLLGLNDGGGSSNRAMTKEEAQSKLADLKADQTFIKRWASGDKAAQTEIAELSKLIVGPAPR